MSRAADWVAENFTFSHETTVVTKDAVSNCVGGLLGAYELSRNTTFLGKAAGLMSGLLKAFEGGGGALFGHANECLHLELTLVDRNLVAEYPYRWKCCSSNATR